MEKDEQHTDEGISWLELFADFELTTGTTARTLEGSIRDGSTLLRREPPVKTLINIFQSEVLKAAEVLFTRDVLRICKPCKGGRARLAGLAARGGAACISGWPCWSAERLEDVMVAVLQQRGIPETRSRPGIAEGGLFLVPARIKYEFPPRWRSRHTHMDVTCTTAPDARVLVHFPVGCSNCGQTHVLSERPSFTGGASQRFRCKKRHVQVRSSMCICKACGNKLVRCRCATAGAHSTPFPTAPCRLLWRPGLRASRM